jgi:hypothetical protein
MVVITEFELQSCAEIVKKDLLFKGFGWVRETDGRMWPPAGGIALTFGYRQIRAEIE